MRVRRPRDLCAPAAAGRDAHSDAAPRLRANDACDATPLTARRPVRIVTRLGAAAFAGSQPPLPVAGRHAVDREDAVADDAPLP